MRACLRKKPRDCSSNSVSTMSYSGAEMPAASSQSAMSRSSCNIATSILTAQLYEPSVHQKACHARCLAHSHNRHALLAALESMLDMKSSNNTMFTMVSPFLCLCTSKERVPFSALCTR